MGWGTALRVAYDVASTTVKAAYNTYKAVTYVQDKVVEAAVATKDAVVAGAVATKDAVIAGAVATKDVAVAGAKAVGAAVEYGADAAKLGAIKAREAQASFQHGRSQLSQCKAGSPIEACPQKVAECSELADARNKAILSDDTYNTNPTQADKDKLLAQTGYRRLDPVKDAGELDKSLGIKNPKESLAPDGTDFRANVYAKGVEPNVEYVVGYRGTQTGADWNQNRIQGSGGQSDSYDRAKRLASITDAHAQKNGHALSFTGHSLGGGMASAASASTGRAASTFNAAGLNANTVGGSYPNPPTPTKAYFTPTDPLSALQDNRAPLLAGITGGVSAIPLIGPLLAKGLGGWVLGNEVGGTPVLPKAYGDRRPLPYPPGRHPPDLSLDGFKEAHGMGLVVEGIDAQRKKLGCQ